MAEEYKTCRCCGRDLPIGSFAVNGWGATSVCKECNTANRKKAHEKKTQEADALKNAKEAEEACGKKVSQARQMRLSEFSPRELMEELARRGYRGKLEFTFTKTIDITNF